MKLNASELDADISVRIRISKFDWTARRARVVKFKYVYIVEIARNEMVPDLIFIFPTSFQLRASLCRKTAEAKLETRIVCSTNDPFFKAQSGTFVKVHCIKKRHLSRDGIEIT